MPATSFAEYHPSETIPGANGNTIKAAAWFRLAGEEDRPPFAFPCFYRYWNWKERGLRRKSDQELADVDALVLAMTFLTCPPNRVVRPIHPKAMPVILDTQDEFETWLTTGGDRAAALQRPLLDEKLAIAFIGEKEDEQTL